MKYALLLLGLITAIGISHASAAEISFNGFGSVYGGMNFTQGRNVSEFKDTNPAFAQFSLLGLNIGSRLADNIQMHAQFVVNGKRTIGSAMTPAWDLHANWAFLSFAATSDWHIKVGRQLYPDWLAAEFIDVGFLQPNRRLPSNVEGLSPYKAFDGLLTDYILDLGAAGYLTASLFGGRAQTDVGSNGNTISAEAKGFFGTALTLKGDGYKVRAQINRERASISGTTNGASRSNDQYAYTFGASYDKNNFVIWSEYGGIKSDQYVNSLTGGSAYAESAHVFYALFGYRLGAFMPRYMWSDCDYNHLGIGYGRSFTHNLGLNYQMKDNVILKFDLLFEQFKNIGAAGNGAAGKVYVIGADATAFTAGMDFIF